MILGIVRLAPGRAAFYDDLTNIHLTPMRPEAPVYAGMNTTKLKKGVAFGTIKLISGSLDMVETKPAANNYMQQPVQAAPVRMETVSVPIDQDFVKTVPIDMPEVKPPVKETKTKSKKDK